MSEYLKKLTDKFFSDQCTADEAEQVLDWLETPEGQKYLDENISKESENIDENSDLDHEFALSTEFDSEKFYLTILQKLKIKGLWEIQRPRFNRKFFYLAASVLVILTAPFLYISGPSVDSDSQSELIVLNTSDSEQREVRLNDGTRIFMNSRTTIRIQREYYLNERVIELEGEAFFDVVRIPDKPFIIEMKESTIEVIGTAFNIKNIEGTSRIEVSVTEGIVAFSGNNEDEQSKVTLREGDYAKWNRASDEMKIEQFGVKNYHAWMSNEFHFEDMYMHQVCVQLHRFYDISCSFIDSSIENRRLTAQFKVSDLKNTLSVIGLSLKLDYQLEENEVIWRNH